MRIKEKSLTGYNYAVKRSVKEKSLSLSFRSSNSLSPFSGLTTFRELENIFFAYKIDNVLDTLKK